MIILKRKGYAHDLVGYTPFFTMEEKDMLISSLTKKYYDEKDSVRLVNPKQCAFYWSHGVKPISIYPSKDLKTGEDILVFIFKMSETQELYKEWQSTKPDISKPENIK